MKESGLAPNGATSTKYVMKIFGSNKWTKHFMNGSVYQKCTGIKVTFDQVCRQAGSI